MLTSDQSYLNWQDRLKTDPWFRRFWVFCGIYIVGFFYVGIILFFLPSFRAVAVLAFIAFLFSRFVLCEVIYLFYKRPRPCQRLKFTPPTSSLFLSWVNKRFDSMPSGHAASLAAISMACAIFLPPLGIVGFIAAIFNGLGRVVLGYHHPSDILAGWIVGLFAGWATVYWLAPLLVK